MRDKNYLALAAKRQLTVSPMSGQEAQKVIGQIFSVPSAVTARARDIVK